MECDSKRIDTVRIYRPSLAAGFGKYRLRLYHAVFVILYLYQTAWVVSTIGEPYKKFLEKADAQGFEVMEGQTVMRAELEHSLDDLNDPNRYTKKMGWFDWMDMDLEEAAERKRRERERNVLDSLPKHMRVPSKYAPAFVPSLLMGIFLTLHAFIMLMQHWSVGFNTWINFKEADAQATELPDEMMELNLDDLEVKKTKKTKGPLGALTDIPSYLPTHARISPAKGRHVLVELQYFPALGMTFEYHHRRYVFNRDSSIWTKIRCRHDIPLEFFSTWKGFMSREQIAGATLRYGPNEFQVKQPTFGELYKNQLLSPFTVFQLFCVILWMLDDYWQYSAFTLFMILTFEGTVVFQRIKSLQALRGMGSKSRAVWVYRLGGWMQVDSTDLLPGDLLSLTLVKPHYAKEQTKRRIQDESGNVVPADILLLRGSTVANEASLTGESIPQMKEGLQDFVEGESLAMKTTHKSNVLHAGTKILQCKGEGSGEGGIQIPMPPDNGSVCFVLRTGFSSSQGKLVRMIEGSQEKVKGHERETGFLLLLLFVFALASSSYVLYHGLQNDKRSQYELLLHCILIITSVIPPELPMQMALAVNSSLMTLMKMQIFCTEPFRVPIAGKLDSCLFDKTGTLTTDELVAVGYSKPDQQKNSELTSMSKVEGPTALVLAGCHSLVNIDGETTGDPIENASFSSMRWCISGTNGHAVPSPATEKREGGTAINLGADGKVSSVEILSRHHFSSKLQRMSCVVRAVDSGKIYSVAKGSPEAVGRMLTIVPTGYEQQSKSLAKQGLRVIALAFKTIRSDKDVEACIDSRAACEKGLTFAGFVAFSCRVRKDTAKVLARLKQGGMSITMVTGDSILTAIHVSREVGICKAIGVDEDADIVEEEPNEELRALLESKRGSPATKNKKSDENKEFLPVLILEPNLSWQSYEDDSKFGDFSAAEIPELSQKYDLAMTGKSLAAAMESDDETQKVLGYVKVFARMTPDLKSTVVDSLHSVGALCLMCGDGANDVGALKQADIGVALLSGFGDVNVDRGEDAGKKKKLKDEEAVATTAIMSAQQVEALRKLPAMLIKAHIRKVGGNPDKYPEIVEKEDLIKLYQIKAREAAIKKYRKQKAGDTSSLTPAEKQAKIRADAADKQRRMMQRVAELEAQGVQWATFKAMREFYNDEMAEAKKKRGQHSTIEGSASALAAQFEDMESGDLPMVQIGDASIAAPFTSKMPSIKACVDIVRQGRCTLVSSIQMYQILALNCLISSYSLSVLYLDGIKYGDTQMTAMGMLGSISFMSVSRSKPLEKLSKVRPLTSIFHPALFISLLGQFTIHLVTMILATMNAKKHLPDDHEVDLDGVFKPGILNTVVFLVSNVQQVTVFVVNLQGRPFMTGLSENRPLLYSLLATFILTFMFASESVPSLNKYFQLVPFPSEDFRDYILKILVADVILSFSFDRLMKFIFSPDILFASFRGTTTKEMMGIAQTFGVMLVLMNMFLGNNETWDELMEQQERLLGLNETNSTNATEVITEVAKTAAECIGAACKGGADGVDDEF